MSLSSLESDAYSYNTALQVTNNEDVFLSLRASFIKRHDSARTLPHDTPKGLLSYLRRSEGPYEMISSRDPLRLILVLLSLVVRRYCV